MNIGYARVSGDDQNLDLQRDALRQAGCERLYEEKESGGRIDRPELLRLMEVLRAGDTLVVWRLDRLGRSLKHLMRPSNGSKPWAWASAASPRPSTRPPAAASWFSTSSRRWPSSSAR